MTIYALLFLFWETSWNPHIFILDFGLLTLTIDLFCSFCVLIRKKTVHLIEFWPRGSFWKTKCQYWKAWSWTPHNLDFAWSQNSEPLKEEIVKCLMLRKSSFQFEGQNRNVNSIKMFHFCLEFASSMWLYGMPARLSIN